VDPEHLADPVDQAWEKVERAWDDPDAHRRFIALCRALGRLPDAGRLYREVRERDDLRRSTAEARIADLLSAATLELEAQRSEPPAGRSRRWLTLIGLLVMLALMAAAARAFSVGG
jgi:hypothetical protein